MPSIRAALFATLALACGLVDFGEALDSSTDPFCACTSCCYVQETDFAYKNLLSLTFPKVSLSGEYTVLNDGGTHTVNGETLNGTPYKYVLKYVNEKTAAFDVNMRIFANDITTPLNCGDSYVYVGVEEDASAYHKFPLVSKTESGTSFCTIDIDYKLSRDELATDDRVYFAFNTLVDETTEFRMMPDSSAPIVPEDDIEDFQFFLNKTTLSADTADSNYFINIDLSVSDINQMDVDGTNCLTLGALMDTAYLAGDAQNCTLERLDAELEWPDSPAYGVDTLYRYILRQSDFEKCAKSVISDGKSVTFTTTLHLPVRDDDNKCFYFQPGFAEQSISITMNAQVTDQSSALFAQFGSQLIDVQIERCTPIEDYVIPQAITKFVVRTTSAYPTVKWEEASTPTLGSNSLPLFGGHDPEIENPVPTSNCSTSTEGENEITVCDHKFHTRSCSKIYTTEDGECAFERSDLNFIDNMVFHEYLDDTFYLEHRTARIQTDLEYTEFGEEMCSAPDARPLVNVEDEFPSSLSVRNYFLDTTVAWDNATSIRFDDQIILRMAVGESAGVELTDLEVFIKNVLVTLREPTGSQEIITEMSFNVAEKVQFQQTAWSLFYSDPVFCSYYDSTHDEERCRVFFDETRVNALNNDGAALSTTNVNNMCQLDAKASVPDTRNADYFVFDPKIWFADLYDRAYLQVDFSVTAVIHSCGPASSGRRLSHEVTGSKSLLRQRKLADAESDVMYVSNDVMVVFGGSGDQTISTGVSASLLPDSVVGQNRLLIIGLAVGSSVFGCCIIAFVARRYKRRNNESNRGEFAPIKSSEGAQSATALGLSASRSSKRGRSKSARGSSATPYFDF